ncbi:hypothetical protein B5S28_g5246 [[Candida] boidinii]|nr:hypothetical protein B5S28_g5246 [[Candida] boidinii]OWB62941.1 hypothetical protein B5S29_g3891 [[Candida] boidinii]
MNSVLKSNSDIHDISSHANNINHHHHLSTTSSPSVHLPVRNKQITIPKMRNINNNNTTHTQTQRVTTPVGHLVKKYESNINTNTNTSSNTSTSTKLKTTSKTNIPLSPTSSPLSASSSSSSSKFSNSLKNIMISGSRKLVPSSNTQSSSSNKKKEIKSTKKLTKPSQKVLPQLSTPKQLQSNPQHHHQQQQQLQSQSQHSQSQQSTPNNNSVKHQISKQSIQSNNSLITNNNFPSSNVTSINSNKSILNYKTSIPKLSSKISSSSISISSPPTISDLNNDHFTIFKFNSARINVFSNGNLNNSSNTDLSPTNDSNSSLTLLLNSNLQQSKSILSSGSLLGHGNFEIYQITNKTITYLQCGSVIYPILPRFKILRTDLNVFILLLSNPERYWKITLNTNDKQILNSLGSCLINICEYRSLFFDDSEINEINETNENSEKAIDNTSKDETSIDSISSIAEITIPNKTPITSNNLNNEISTPYIPDMIINKNSNDLIKANEIISSSINNLNSNVLQSPIILSSDTLILKHPIPIRPPSTNSSSLDSILDIFDDEIEIEMKNPINSNLNKSKKIIQKNLVDLDEINWMDLEDETLKSENDLIDNKKLYNYFNDNFDSDSLIINQNEINPTSNSTSNLNSNSKNYRNAFKFYLNNKNLNKNLDLNNLNLKDKKNFSKILNNAFDEINDTSITNTNSNANSNSNTNDIQDHNQDHDNHTSNHFGDEDDDELLNEFNDNDYSTLDTDMGLISIKDTNNNINNNKFNSSLSIDSNKKLMINKKRITSSATEIINNSRSMSGYYNDSTSTSNINNINNNNSDITNSKRQLSLSIQYLNHSKKLSNNTIRSVSNNSILNRFLNW